MVTLAISQEILLVRYYFPLWLALRNAMFCSQKVVLPTEASDLDENLIVVIKGGQKPLLWVGLNWPPRATFGSLLLLALFRKLMIDGCPARR